MLTILVVINWDFITYTYFDWIESISGLEAKRSEHNERGPGGAIELAEAVDAGHDGDVVTLSLGLVLQQVRQRT